jgi:hypothetical protein
MHVEQCGRCAICGREPNARRPRLVVDHCHRTGRNRGLLCDRCNRAIGLLGETVETLEAAVGYLRRIGS